jgi:hypothetical protein
MTSYDPNTNVFISSVSPFQKSFVPQKFTTIRHVNTSAEVSFGKNIDEGWNETMSFNHTRRESSFSSLPSSVPRIIPSHPKSHDTMNGPSTGLSICHQPSILNPKSDIEDGIPTVCPCCHLRRRSSTENIELRSPKYIHAPHDDYCGDFCPDLSISNIVSLPTARRHNRHSKLCEELKSSYDFGNNETVDLQNTAFPSDISLIRQSSKNGRKTGSRATEYCTNLMENNDVNWWAAGDFD